MSSVGSSTWLREPIFCKLPTCDVIKSWVSNKSLSNFTIDPWILMSQTENFIDMFQISQYNWPLRSFHLLILGTKEYPQLSKKKTTEILFFLPPCIYVDTDFLWYFSLSKQIECRIKYKNPIALLSQILTIFEKVKHCPFSLIWGAL